MGRLAGLEQLRPEVNAVEFEEVEGEQGGLVVKGPAVQLLKHRQPGFVTPHRLAIERTRFLAETNSDPKPFVRDR